MGSEVQWNGYGKFSITVPLRPRPLVTRFLLHDFAKAAVEKAGEFRR
jgi:hypothetical protein